MSLPGEQIQSTLQLKITSRTCILKSSLLSLVQLPSIVLLPRASFNSMHGTLSQAQRKILRTDHHPCRRDHCYGHRPTSEDTSPPRIHVPTHLRQRCKQSHQGGFSRAEKMLQSNLSTLKRLYGVESDATLICMGRLVHLLSCQDLWDKAEELSRQEVESREVFSGPDDIQTIKSIWRSEILI